MLAALRARSEAGEFAVVHARRGDKIDARAVAGACPDQIAAATHPAHIAKFLEHTAKIKPGASVYIMSNEKNWSHFAALESEFGYPISTFYHYEPLAALMRGCLGPAAEAGAAGAPLCENFQLFAIEEELMAQIPVPRRISTLRWTDAVVLGGSGHYLMEDFKGKCTKDGKSASDK